MVLNKETIQTRLRSLQQWELLENSILKEFTLKNFADAMAFTTKVALLAEKIGHHPDIYIHSWNKVRITLSTHGEGGITEKDFELAYLIDNS